MFIIFFRSVILYVLIIFAIRLMGKRQLGELSPNEFVVAILISNIATLPAEDSEIPLIRGIVPILTLVCLDVIFSYLELKSRGLRRVMSGSPKVIISHGNLDQKTLKSIRFTIDDVMEALREQGYFDISEIEFAVVETTGKLSAYPKPMYQPLTPETLKHTKPTQNPPQTIIDDGKIIKPSLEILGMNEKQLEIILSKKDLSPKDVFLMTSDGKGNNTIIKKEG